MRKFITIVALLFSMLFGLPLWAATFTTTGTGGNLSAGTSYAGGTAPNCTTGTDLVIVVPGSTLTQDANCQLGSTSAVGIGLRVEGTVGNPGVFIAASGLTLTLNGADKTTNANLQVDRYGEFYTQPGTHII